MILLPEPFELGRGQSEKLFGSDLQFPISFHPVVWLTTHELNGGHLLRDDEVDTAISRGEQDSDVGRIVFCGT